MKKLEKLTEIIEKMSPRKSPLLCGSAKTGCVPAAVCDPFRPVSDQNNGKVAAGNVTVVEAARYRTPDRPY